MGQIKDEVWKEIQALKKAISQSESKSMLQHRKEINELNSTASSLTSNETEADDEDDEVYDTSRFQEPFNSWVKLNKEFSKTKKNYNDKVSDKINDAKYNDSIDDDKIYEDVSSVVTNNVAVINDSI